MMRLLWAAAFLAAAGPARALDFSKNAIGTSGSDFLLTDIGARGIAMGGAFTALADGADSLYWNPAGLAKIPRFSAEFMYSKYVQDISYQSISAAQRINDAGVAAGGVRYRDIGSIPQTDLAGNSVGSFHPRDYVAELGWGQAVYDLSDSDVDVAMGVTGRVIHSDYGLKADGFGGDVGIQSRFLGGPFLYDAGLSVQNVGVGQKFDKVRDTLPTRIRLGGAVYPIKPLTLSLEAVLPVNNVVHGALGAEYALEAGKGVKGAARVGFNSLTAQSLGVASCFSGGFGLSVGDLSFDYAFVPFGALGDSVHRFSLSFNLPSTTGSKRYRER